jgi:hypothetical protein
MSSSPTKQVVNSFLGTAVPRGQTNSNGTGGPSASGDKLPITVTYQPGGKSVGNTFADWGALIDFVTYIVVTLGYPGLISYQFDFSLLGFGGDPVIPASAIPGSNMQWSNVTGQSYNAIISLSSGTTFPQWQDASNPIYWKLSNLTVQFNSSSPYVSTSNGDVTFVLDNAAHFANIGTAPVMEFNLNSDINIVMYNNSIISSGFHFKSVIICDSTSGYDIIMHTGSNIEEDGLGASSTNSILVTMDSGCGIGQQPTYGAFYQITASADCGIPTLPAGGTVFFSTMGQDVVYTPSVLANWSGTAPTSVANALDRIAAKIGPIS